MMIKITPTINKSHILDWPPCGSLLSTTCSVTGPTPTLSPSFYWLRPFSSQAFFSPIGIPQHFSNLVILHLSAYKDGSECSETSAYKIQTPGNYAEESIQNPILPHRFKHKTITTTSTTIMLVVTLKTWLNCGRRGNWKPFCRLTFTKTTKKHKRHHFVPHREHNLCPL